MRVGTRVKVVNEAGTEYGTVVRTPFSALFDGGIYGVRSDRDGEVYKIPLQHLQEIR